VSGNSRMSPGESYWAKLTAQRIQRRQALKVVASGSAAALALSFVGCGGDSANKTAENAPSTDKSGLVSTAVDSTTKATPGGTLTLSLGSDTPSFDALSSIAIPPAMHNEYVYARLVNANKVFNLVKGEAMDPTVDPYAAESWEQSPDGLTLTFKLRANGGLDPRPPTNGRNLDAQDVVFAYNRYKATGRSRGLVSNELNKDAPVISVTAVDPRTVLVKLAYPSVSILPLLGFFFYYQLQPREADGGFDPKQTMRGSGPWMLDEYKPSTSFSYKKNPNFYRKDRPFFDGVELPIITEYAQGLAQLKAGRLHSFNVRAEDLVQTKQDVPSLNLYPVAAFPAGSNIAFFAFKQGSMWQDERLRQALSMMVDRDLYISTMYNVDKFTSQGLSVETRWNTVFPANEPAWLDPQSSEFGPNAKYFKLDPAEAKKLVQATGRSVIEAPFNTIPGLEYGPDYKREAEILKGMWESSGVFKFSTSLHDYTTDFIPKIGSYPAGGHTFDGVALASITGYPEVDVYLSDHYSPGGALNHFETDFPNDTQWQSMVKAQKSEFDTKKRLAMLKEIQRYHAGKMYGIHRAGAALGFQLWNPGVMNVRAFASRFGGQSPTAELMNYWLSK
jgi:ABC-type transport system substrate-binding protein